ncbi:MAG: N-acetyltransferase [Thaumarchaeota archaeon]|nr:MAG: N-acetyltransferase [Nitrososphaerota archaeon]
MASPEFRIERAGPGDLRELHELEVKCFGKDAYSKATLRFLLTDSRCISFKAVMDDGSLAGFIIGRLENIGGKTVGRIYTINVDPRFRRIGIAKALMKKIEAEFAAWGCVEIILEVAVDNRPALELYKSLGFKFTRLLKDYYGPGRHAYEAKKLLSESIIRSR